jgi:tRNA/tmRNA/rRNA uracil-C5-methylase (TrmA/RlmC/RlmD family)
VQSRKNKDEIVDENNENSEQEVNNETKLTFRISPFSFFQTNTLGAEKLF